MNVEAVSKLADGDGNAASTEVVAALDHAGDLRSAEEALDLALFDRIALLHFCAGGFEGVGVLLLGRAGSAAAAIAPGLAAQEHDDVAWFWTLAHDVFSRRCCDNGANLHALGFVARMVDFVDNAGGHADLVAVGGKAFGSQRADLALRELALQGFAGGFSRIGCAGDAHALVNIAASAQRIADGAAKAGGCAAEWFNFSWMVVGLVFEHVDPRLLDAVDVDVGLDGAGVDLFALVEITHKTMLLEIFCGNGAEVHERDRWPFLAIFVNVLTQSEVFVVDLLHRWIFDGDIGDHRIEGGVTAVVGPVGVDNLELSLSWIALLFLEVGLQKSEVVHIHGKAVAFDDGSQSFAISADQAFHCWHSVGSRRWCFKGFWFFKRSETRFHRVHEVMLNSSDILCRERAEKHVNLRRLDDRTRASHNLDTLRAAVGALIVLARQRLDSEDCLAVILCWQRLCIDLVDAWLREYEIADLFCIERFVEIQIVATDDAHIFQRRKAKIAHERLEQRRIFFAEIRFTFNKKAFDFAHCVLPLL